MKKTILVVLMVLMISTFCLAEIEPEGIFSIGGTLWEATYIFPPKDCGYTRELGFYRWGVYREIGPGGLGRVPHSFYVDLGIANFFMAAKFEIRA